MGCVHSVIIVEQKKTPEKREDDDAQNNAKRFEHRPTPFSKPVLHVGRDSDSETYVGSDPSLRYDSSISTPGTYSTPSSTAEDGCKHFRFDKRNPEIISNGLGPEPKKIKFVSTFGGNIPGEIRSIYKPPPPNECAK